MVPLSSFSIPSVISASRLGRAAPIPIPPSTKVSKILKREVLKNKMMKEHVKNKKPKKADHFITILLFPTFFPATKEEIDKASKGIAITKPFFVFTI